MFLQVRERRELAGFFAFQGRESKVNFLASRSVLKAFSIINKIGAGTRAPKVDFDWNDL